MELLLSMGASRMEATRDVVQVCCQHSPATSSRLLRCSASPAREKLRSGNPLPLPLMCVCHLSLQRAVKMAMTPLLNQMSVVGIVSIPGMMTGMCLGA